MNKLSCFYDMLNKHDWFYNFSDDGKRYTAGLEKEAELGRIAVESPEHAALYEDFVNYIFSIPVFGNSKQRAPKPTRPIDTSEDNGK